MTEKIDIFELRKMLLDPNVPLTSVKPYIIVSPDPKKPFSQHIDVNRELVIIPEDSRDYETEGFIGDFFWGIGVALYNRKARNERRRLYEKRIREGWSGLRLVEKGDSWCLYPVGNDDDFVDYLLDDYAIYCLSAAGAEMKDMIQHGDEIKQALRFVEADGLIWSAGGNDIAGDELKNYVRAYDASSPNRKAGDYIQPAFEVFLQDLKEKYKSFFSDIVKDYPDLKILTHGYDRPYPKEDGGWLGPTLKGKQIPEDKWYGIIGFMIDRFNQILVELQTEMQGVFYYVNCLDQVGHGNWKDELHANPGGCQRVAEKFRERIALAIPAQSTPPEDPTESDEDFQVMPGDLDLSPPDLTNASEEMLSEGEILPDDENGFEDTEGVDVYFEDENILEGTRSMPGASWPSNDKNAPDYAHITPLQKGEVFEFKGEDLELLIKANHFQPISQNNKIILGLRGCRLKSVHEAEGVTELELVDVRPDHKNFNCVMGFYDLQEKKFWAYTGSTVPNVYSMQAYYRKVHRLPGRQFASNLLPTGSYPYRKASHGWHKKLKKWKVPVALRLSDPRRKGNDGAATVLRTRNDLTYGTADYWDNSVPADNIHAAFRTTSFSSAGCLTIRGANKYFTHNTSHQWKKFLKMVYGFKANERIDLVLLTGAEAAIAANLRTNGQNTDQTVILEQLERLRTGSQGERVEKLQKFLGVIEDGFGPKTKKALTSRQKLMGDQGKADGVYSPEMDALFGKPILKP